MEVIRLRKGSLALGTFDGLHKGHEAVLLSAKMPARAITFYMPPMAEKHSELLMEPEEKIKRLQKMGFETTVLNFEDVKDIEACEFLEQIDREYSPAVICCGENYRFGHFGKGDVSLLKSFCEEKGIEARISPMQGKDNVKISSSVIRSLIKSGNLKEANEMLTEPFSISGEVIHGDSRGRKMGIPTVNFFYPESVVRARHGVYAARIEVDGKTYPAITYVGNRPTYHIDKCVCETNILDFSGDVYGKEVKVYLLSFLREEKKFKSLSELAAQIETDIKRVKENT